ncbi:MAG TPA: DUF4258 domain-containing protein [Mycobacteriales bacterium]|jgi:hypothetical protein|nr:DUF4258 domain-containing protein [Mycobacteriales bacterium]
MPSRPLSRVLTLHVFEKVRALDLTLAEFELLLDGGEVIEQTQLRGMELKRVVLVLDRLRPLHVVVVVDAVRQEERIITVYEPDRDRWVNFRERRRP